jgi:hypothetical protein
MLVSCLNHTSSLLIGKSDIAASLRLPHTRTVQQASSPGVCSPDKHTQYIAFEQFAYPKNSSQYLKSYSIRTVKIAQASPPSTPLAPSNVRIRMFLGLPDPDLLV